MADYAASLRTTNSPNLDTPQSWAPHRCGIAPRIGRKWPGLWGHHPKHRGGHPKRHSTWGSRLGGY